MRNGLFNSEIFNNRVTFEIAAIVGKAFIAGLVVSVIAGILVLLLAEATAMYP